MVLNAIITFFFFFNDTATTEIYTLSLHDALPISGRECGRPARRPRDESAPRHRDFGKGDTMSTTRSEEHTSELQSPCNLVCRLLLEKKKKNSVLTTMELPSQPCSGTTALVSLSAT